jgi:hypothetical protein
VSRFDPLSFVSGAVITVLGVLLLLDQVDELDLGFEWAAPAALGAVGIILVVSGLSGRR